MDSTHNSLLNSSVSSSPPDTSSWGCYISDNRFTAMLSYLLNEHSPDIVQLLLENESTAHYSVHIRTINFLEKHVDLAEEIFFESEETLVVFNQALLAALYQVWTTHNLKGHMTFKKKVHLRMTKLPVNEEIWRSRAPKSKDIGIFLAFDGTIIRSSSAKVLKNRNEYLCKQCRCKFVVEADYKVYYAASTPLRCLATFNCQSQKFTLLSSTENARDNCQDYQEVKVQEQVRKLSMGTIPRSVVVILEDDLVDCCKAGDDVIVVGIVSCRWQPLQGQKQCDLELVIKANSIEVCNDSQSSGKGMDSNELQDEFNCFWATFCENPLTARNHILSSLCPQVYGLYVVKLAVALILAGGVSRTDSCGSHIRGESHMLLVGDPGTGKSQFLKYAAKIIPRSVLTTGIGSSTAGLTVSAIRDGPQWVLEAGALVLADGGICCIDEFSGIKEHDRTAIHEAMEQQTISVAKAGLVCKLNTRTSILAATNPKLGKYDLLSSVEMNVGLASPLLSRFDIILILNDENHLNWDSIVADYLLKDGDNSIATPGNTELWDLERMQAYFSVIHNLKPVVSSEADEVLKAYYRSHRNSDSRSAARTTIRLLESLIRLSEAHARLMFRSAVTIQDAIAAITVMESSMQGCSLLPTGNILHSVFPVDPEKEYRMQCRQVLKKLNLNRLYDKYYSSNSAVTSKNTSFLSSSQNSLQPQVCNSRESILRELTNQISQVQKSRPNRIPVNNNSSVNFDALVTSQRVEGYPTDSVLNSQFNDTSQSRPRATFLDSSPFEKQQVKRTNSLQTMQTSSKRSKPNTGCSGAAASQVSSIPQQHTRFPSQRPKMTSTLISQSSKTPSAHDVEEGFDLSWDTFGDFDLESSTPVGVQYNSVMNNAESCRPGTSAVSSQLSMSSLFKPSKSCFKLPEDIVVGGNNDSSQPFFNDDTELMGMLTDINWENDNDRNAAVKKVVNTSQDTVAHNFSHTSGTDHAAKQSSIFTLGEFDLDI